MQTAESSATVHDEHAAQLEALHAELARANVIPTWRDVGLIVSREPRAGYGPYLWKWALMRRLLMRAGELVTPERGAERRSIDHVHPSLKASLSASHTLATAFQLVRPGEIAPAHRHTAAAIRFVVQGGGGEVYTAVQGEPLMMEENDLVLTPSWCWHDHANKTGRDIIWLDALDYPLVNLMRASFFEAHPDESQTLSKPAGYTGQRVGLARPAWEPYPEQVPLVRYAWTDTRATLESLRGEAGSPYDGILLEYVNPFDGGSTLPTLTCYMQLLRAGERTRAHRATSSTVYLVTGGAGYSVVDGQRVDWAKSDVFVVPPWAWHEHVNTTDGDAFLFSVSDRPVLNMLGMYREEALATADGHQAVESVFEPLT